MTFIEPFLLWGALAILIPIAIHFWHQKRGKPLPWAATEWLTERNQQQSRGLRLDNVLLLLLRCLLLMLLAILLAQPVLNWFDKEATVKRIHLVQPNALVLADFRFELDEARTKGEQIVLTDKITNPLSLQTAIHKLPAENTELHLYVVNQQALADVPVISVPVQFQLHTVVDSTSKPRPYLALPNGKRLFVDSNGKLNSTATPDPLLSIQALPALSGPIRVGLDYKSAAERQTIRAALNALANVYSLPLLIEEKKAANEPYDWILTDRSISTGELTQNPKTLFTVSGIGQTPTSGNVVFSPEMLSPQTSELVVGGQLPEWLGEQLIRHFGLIMDSTPLSQQALKSLFVTSAKPNRTQQAGIQNALTLLCIVLLIIERWIALTKNA
jgi:hypothetical protein